MAFKVDDGEVSYREQIVVMFVAGILLGALIGIGLGVGVSSNLNAENLRSVDYVVSCIEQHGVPIKTAGGDDCRWPPLLIDR